MPLFERSTGTDNTDKPRLSGDQIVALIWTSHLGLKSRAQISAELTRLGFDAADKAELVGWLDLFDAAPDKQRWSTAFGYLFGAAQADFFNLRNKATFDAALALV